MQQLLDGCWIVDWVDLGLVLSKRLGIVYVSEAIAKNDMMAYGRLRGLGRRLCGRSSRVV